MNGSRVKSHGHRLFNGQIHMFPQSSEDTSTNSQVDRNNGRSLWLEIFEYLLKPKQGNI